jgi:ribosomal-protein-alanine N-acetyltransferase
MISKSCSYETERLLVTKWHGLSADEWTSQDLAVVVQSMLTPAVTRSLPEPWQGEYTLERARGWVQERDEEGATLLVIERSSKRPAGLVILFEIEQEGDAGPEVRLGYLLAESAWGRGLATELIHGLVEWSKDAGIGSLVGGVARENVPSKRVLEKNGFVCTPESASASEQLFELRL